MNGASTNPDCHVLAYAGAQVKKGLEIAKKLGAENFGERVSVFALNVSREKFNLNVLDQPGNVWHLH